MSMPTFSLGIVLALLVVLISAVVIITSIANHSVDVPSLAIWFVAGTLGVSRLVP